MKSFKLIFFCALLTPALAQKNYFSSVIFPDTIRSIEKDSAFEYSKYIQADKLKEIIEYLASDSCEGRELGSKGNERASNFIAGLLNQYNVQKIGDSNSYFQELGFKWIYWDKLSFKINGVNYKQLWDYLIIPDQNDDLEMNTSEVLFLGYGIDDPKYNDYKNLDVKNKAILIYKGEPKNKKGEYLLSSNLKPSPWSSDLQLKIRTAKKHGAKIVLVIEDKFKEFVDSNRSSVVSPSVIMDKNSNDFRIGINTMHLSSTTVSMLLGKSIKKVIKARDKINRTGKSNSFIIKTNLEFIQKRNVRSEKGRNILAYIEGTDKKNELIIVSAHYDHIGKRGNDVYNGADDNASGTSAVIEIAHTLQKLKEAGKGSRRSVLCMLVTGEEKGLLGSMYYVNHPTFPLSSTMVDINVDMIGRTDPKYLKDSNYIYVIGSDRLSLDLHKINVDVNQKYSQLKLDHTYNSETDANRFYYRSDHYNFAEKGIPAIFFFSGVHEDYHRITDDASKILFGKTEKIARHIFLLTWSLANIEFKLSPNP
ncbi:MAG: M28 family peptidase [Saprospiraceae bacterium]|nr:M28 family peptidase [Saprospiraceae bacterium]MBK8485414.1 M28 family peptidase [Saprospiraceae bacterium]MBK9222643.1 M28 family peptidase [Saprospiraceae bacterium]MBK9720312.1 M28 family peptidase [Saprospiraceae bacterium]MBK9727307.1 M28 family peptidase [Saprospiraceae bacterium]